MHENGLAPPLRSGPSRPQQLSDAACDERGELPWPDLRGHSCLALRDLVIVRPVAQKSL